MYCLQSRWKIENRQLVYYGLRNKDNLFKNCYKLKNKELSILYELPKNLNIEEKKTLKKFLGIAVVEENQIKKIPTCIEEAKFCSNCAANDFIIPGLEFDENGLCPMCQTKEETKHLKSVVPIMNVFPHSHKSRFDVALFYTGGKDSTFLLYYLAKVLNLKVLALTWEIPYMSTSARESISNAKSKLENVEFITRYVANSDLKKIYSHLYSLSENTCACPSLAYMLFYPELVINKVPYFVVGNEPVQILGLYYNHMAPKIAYHFASNKILNALINIGRILTLHPPLKKGQFQTLATMKQLAYGDNILKKISGYSNQLVSNVVESIHTIPSLTKPLKKAISLSSRTGNIPAFVQVDLNEISGGRYDWKEVKELIINECGWVAPDFYDKGLHTSCKIEKCKEFSQFIRFYNMKSTMIPFSALEISLASRDKNISKDEAIAEIKNALGFSLTEIPECKIMQEYFKNE